MSDLTDFNVREQLARIDRAVAETQKFQAEQRKLFAEAGKLDRDRVIAPWLTFAAVIGGALGQATFLGRLLGH